MKFRSGKTSKTLKELKTKKRENSLMGISMVKQKNVKIKIMKTNKNLNLKIMKQIKNLKEVLEQFRHDVELPAGKPIENYQQFREGLKMSRNQAIENLEKNCNALGAIRIHTPYAKKKDNFSYQLGKETISVKFRLFDGEPMMETSLMNGKVLKDCHENHYGFQCC